MSGGDQEKARRAAESAAAAAADRRLESLIAVPAARIAEGDALQDGPRVIPGIVRQLHPDRLEFIQGDDYGQRLAEVRVRLGDEREEPGALLSPGTRQRIQNGRKPVGIAEFDLADSRDGTHLRLQGTLLCAGGRDSPDYPDYPGYRNADARRLRTLLFEDSLLDPCGDPEVKLLEEIVGRTGAAARGTVTLAVDRATCDAAWVAVHSFVRLRPDIRLRIVNPG